MKQNEQEQSLVFTPVRSEAATRVVCLSYWIRVQTSLGQIYRLVNFLIHIIHTCRIHIYNINYSGADDRTIFIHFFVFFFVLKKYFKYCGQQTCKRSNSNQIKGIVLYLECRKKTYYTENTERNRVLSRTGKGIVV